MDNEGHGCPRLGLLNLGSGSGGNCSLLVAESATHRLRVLIDCGFSLRRTRTLLSEHDVSLESIDAVVLTHLDGDHFNPVWARELQRTGIPLHVSSMHQSDALAHCTAANLMVFDDRIDFGFGLLADVHMVAHDKNGCAAFRFSFHEHCLGFATDLGHVPDALLNFLGGVDALAFESNYDRSMQMQSNRPEFLKERIMGGNGHLSNEQSLNAILQIEESSELQHIMLLHLSQQCNDPHRIRELYCACAPHLLERLVITSQRTPTSWIECKPVTRTVAHADVVLTQRHPR